MPEPMGKLDTVEVNGPEDEVLDWDAVQWHRVEDEVRRLRQRIVTRGLLEPVAWKAGTAGSKGAPARRRAGATRLLRRCARRARRDGAPGAPAGGQGVLVPARQKKRDAADLADLLRMGRLPHAWIAPPVTRELRELVRHRAKLVAMRSRCKAEVHAVLATGGVWVPMIDLFGIEGNMLLDNVTMPAPYLARIASLRRFVEAFDAEIDLFTGLAQRRLTHDADFTAIQQIPGIGPVLAAVFVAEIGDVHRFDGPAKLTCWAGLTPRHHESDTTVHRGHITKQGSRLVRWAAIESVKILPETSRIGAIRAPAPTWPTACSSPCARSPTSKTGCAKVSPGTYAILENKLSWAPGSIDTILAGGEPTELVPTLRRSNTTAPAQGYRLRPTNTNALSQVSTEELLLELRRRIIAPRDRRQETWDDWDGPDPRGDRGGLDPHGD